MRLLSPSDLWSAEHRSRPSRRSVSISRHNPRTKCRPLTRERVGRILERLNLLHQSDACSATRPWKYVSSNCRRSLNSRGLESVIFSPPLFRRNQHLETAILRILVSLLQICTVRKNYTWTSHCAGQSIPHKLESRLCLLSSNKIYGMVSASPYFEVSYRKV